MAKETSSNNRLFQLVAVIILLAAILVGLIWYYQKTTKPKFDLEAKIPAGIKHIMSIYGPGAGDNFDKPESAALDEDGNIYVADTGNDRIAVFDGNGSSLRTFGSKKTTPVPLGVAVSKSGRVYVTSLMQRQISILDTEGKLLKTVKFTKKEETPLKILINGNKLYITAIGQIMIADMDGNIEKRWGKEGRNLGDYRYPNGIAVGRVGKLKKAIVVSDSNNNRLQILNMSGKPVMYLGQPPKNLKDETLLFGLPTGLTMDDEGYVFVVDTFNHAIRIFDNQGNDLGQLGKQGSADGNYFYPSDIKLISGNRFIITDKWNDRVQICELTVGDAKKAKTTSKPNH